MEWNRDELGKLMQTTRLLKGLSIEDVAEMASLKPESVSVLERGDQTRPPRATTVAKLERALGIELTITRVQQTNIMLYVPADKTFLIEEARTKWPTKSTGGAVMLALQAWSDHREALRAWNRDHPGANLEV